ncbi:hypothetical protein [Clostridium sp.]|uniref:hypothetical protein n=1 Tax=Clostridium sp. TaxID=1506 RepID=UPI0026343F2C|nr:hypothetical protein [Clostridium sp.]
MDKIIRNNFLIIGIFCTMNIIKIPIINLSLAYIFLFITLLMLITRNRFKINIGKRNIKLILFYIIQIASFLITVTYQTGEYITYSFRNIFFVAFLYIPLVLVLDNEDTKIYGEYFCKGLKISIYIQSVWAIMEILLWNIYKFQLNEYIFAEILKVNAYDHSLTNYVYTNQGVLIRASGIGWEPAQLGFLLVLGFFISKSKLSKLFFISLIFISYSRTALVTFIIAEIYFCIKRITKENLMTKKNLIYIFFGVFIMLALMVKFDIYSKMDVIFGRINLSYISSDEGSSRHLLYYPYALYIMFAKTDLIKLFLGYGTGIAGYPYFLNSDVASVLNVGYWSKPWQPETDYVSIFVGNGIMGLVLYLSILRDNLKRIKDLNVFYLGNLLLVISGIFYVYYNYIWVNLILVFLCISKNNVITSMKKNIKE